jgi:hypothetical protein
MNKRVKILALILKLSRPELIKRSVKPELRGDLPPSVALGAGHCTH